MEKAIETSHRIVMADAGRMDSVEDRSIDLVVTSPPYPMIQMWDDHFSAANPAIARALDKADVRQAFEGMHDLLDRVWDEVVRALKPGGIACINIGDATRTYDGYFQLFSNHAEIISRFIARGMSQLPTIIWRKTANAPTKFMGSGMLPPGAYVTLEHEYILIFRNGGKRDFSQAQEKQLRRRSAYFWEERNTWFSDVWTDLLGVSQDMQMAGGRQRSAAYPLELPYRLISMFSLQGEKVLDPFMGTGTTMLAAMCTARNSIGYESDPGLQTAILERVASAAQLANQIIDDRLQAHIRFVKERSLAKGALKHYNRVYGFPVMTRQEEDLCLTPVRHVQYQSNDHFKIAYGLPQRGALGLDGQAEVRPAPSMPQHVPKGRQMKLF